MSEYKIPIRILNCEIVRSTRFGPSRAAAAHVTIDVRDREAALNPANWPVEAAVRFWRRSNESARDEWHNWGTINCNVFN